MSYSQDLKTRAIMLYSNKIRSYRKVATLLHLGKSSIHRWCKQSSYVTLKSNIRKITNCIKSHIKDVIEQNPYTTINDIINSIKNKYSILLSKSGIALTIRKMKYSKKKPTKYVNRANLSEQRQDFETLFRNIKADELLSIDESAIQLHLKPLKGYSKRGKRFYESQNSKTFYNGIKYSLLMAISNSKIIDYKMSSTNYKSDTFNEFIKNINVPNNIKYIIMDNASIHKGCNSLLKEKNLIRLNMPPYSPAYNPIENIFSVVKNAFRKNHNILDFDERFKNSINIINSSILNNTFVSCIKFSYCNLLPNE